MPDASARNPLQSLGTTPIRTAHVDVTDRIRSAIVSGGLPGGTRLMQAELAQQLSVSVTPVREALRNLMSEGLVDYSPFHGATVHEATPEELEDVYEMRSVLIPIAVREGVRNITTEELDTAEGLARRMEIATDPFEWVELNREFHKVFYLASRRPRLHSVLTGLADLSSLYVGVSVSSDAERRARGDADHRKILSSYRDRDVERAIAITVAHNHDTLEVARGPVGESHRHGGVA